MDSIVAQAALAGVTLSSKDLEQIQQVLNEKQQQQENNNNNTDDDDDIQKREPGLYYSTIKENVANELKTAAHSFASTRMIPEIWKWAALSKLRHDIEQIYKDHANNNNNSNNNQLDNKKKLKTVSNEFLLTNFIPFSVQIEKEPTSAKVLRIVTVMPCTEFTTHAVVIADTEVKYSVTEKVRRSAHDIVVPKKKAAIENNSNDNNDESKAAEENHQSETNVVTKKKNPAIVTSTFNYTMEATIVWRTMHFVRKDGVVEGSYEIQSTACRLFECRCPETGNVFALCGAKKGLQQSTSSSNNNTGIILSSGRFHESWWRGYLECYTRPTIHFVFAWLLWQNNPDMRSFIEKNKKGVTSKKSKPKKQQSATSEEQAAQKKKQALRAKNREREPFKQQSSLSKQTPKRRPRGGQGSDENDDDDETEDENDDDNEEENNNIVEVEDFLEDVKTKLHLTLFDHNPSIAVFGMGMNVITNYLSVLFPWIDIHVAELEPSVYASNVLSEDFCENAADLIESKKQYRKEQQKQKQQDQQQQTGIINNNKKNDDDSANNGKQFAHIGDVVELLGVQLKGKEEQQKDDSANNNNDDNDDDSDSSKQQPSIPESGLSLIFLDCFDPVAVNMDHSLQVLNACHKRLRKGGILVTNTHLALTNGGTELRPFMEVFGGDEAVQVVSIFGYQQALIICQKAKNFGNKGNKPLRIAPPPQNVREYRAICRVANACPVFVAVCDGILQSIDKISFFGSNINNTCSGSISSVDDRTNNNINNGSNSSSSKGGKILKSPPGKTDEDFLLCNDEEEASQTMNGNNSISNKKKFLKSTTNNVLPSISEYPSLFCRAKHRIHESCECLACTGKWLDPSVFFESRRTQVKMRNLNGKEEEPQNENAENDDNIVSFTTGRWITRCIDFKDEEPVKKD